MNELCMNLISANQLKFEENHIYDVYIYIIIDMYK